MSLNICIATFLDRCMNDGQGLLAHLARAIGRNKSTLALQDWNCPMPMSPHSSLLCPYPFLYPGPTLFCTLALPSSLPWPHILLYSGPALFSTLAPPYSLHWPRLLLYPGPAHVSTLAPPSCLPWPCPLLYPGTAIFCSAACNYLCHLLWSFFPP